MRILHAIKSVDPAIGGPPAIATRIAAAQAMLGHDVRLVTYRQPRRQGDIDAALDRVPHFENVMVNSLAPPAVFDFLVPRGTRADLRRLVQEADVVHLHNVWQPFLLATARECRRHDRPYILMLNGNLDPWSLSQNRLKKQLALFFVFRRLIDRAAALHLGTSTEHALLQPLDVRVASKIIPNGIFLEELDPLPEPGTFRAAHPQLRDRRFVLFLGRLHYKKGLDVLAEAFGRVAARHPEVDLVVVGPDDGARRSFKERIVRLELQDRVHMPGALFGDDKLAAMVDADCFCLPSRQEAFSMAVLEALACRTPVVISKACHFPEVGKAGAGAVIDFSVGAVGTALDELLSDPELRRRQGAAARELVEKSYTWPVVAEQTVSLYEDVLSARS